MEIKNCYYRVSIKALIFNDAKDKFLLCRNADGRWDLPGGGLDHGTTPQEDLPREIMEEMSLEVEWIAEQPSYFLAGMSTNPPQIPINNVIYETKLKGLDFTPSDECVEIKFVNPEEIKEMHTFAGPQKLAEMFDPENH